MVRTTCASRSNIAWRGPHLYLWLVGTSARADCRLASDMWLCAALGSNICGLETADHNHLWRRQPLLLQGRVYVTGRLPRNPGLPWATEIDMYRDSTPIHHCCTIWPLIALEDPPSHPEQSVAGTYALSQACSTPLHTTVLACRLNDERSISQPHTVRHSRIAHQ